MYPSLHPTIDRIVIDDRQRTRLAEAREARLARIVRPRAHGLGFIGVIVRWLRHGLDLRLDAIRRLVVRSTPA